MEPRAHHALHRTVELGEIQVLLALFVLVGEDAAATHAQRIHAMLALVNIEIQGVIHGQREVIGTRSVITIHPIGDIGFQELKVAHGDDERHDRPGVVSRFV